MRKIVNRLKAFPITWRQIKEILKYGGIAKINVSQIEYPNMLFTSNDVFLVTGGSRGIGRKVTERLLKAGGRVIITGRNENTLLQTKKEIGSSNLETIVWDISQAQEIDTKLLELENRDLHITCLINNAGTYAKTSFPNCTLDDWENVYSTNVKGPFFMCQALCKKWMKYPNRDKKYKIINISSQGGFVSANNPYRMTKWDMRGFTQYLGQSMYHYGIIANGIAPGLIMTDMQPEFQKQKDNYFTNLNTVNRLALPEEIAELVVFLASDASNFIIGQTICCDGGYSIK